MANNERLKEYWRRNLRLMLGLLAVWALVGYGFSMFFAQALNAISLFGFPLGFWFAQQGSIYVFVVLIFIYVWRMKKLDKEYDVHE